MSRRCLVTGGGGFLGGAIVRALVERGDKVRSFARGAYPELAELGVEHLRGDLADLDAVREAVKDVDVVFHVASLVAQYGDPATFDRVNISGTVNVLQAMKELGVRDLVYTSTPSVVNDGHDAAGIDERAPYPSTHLCDYFRSKAAAEQRVLAEHGAEMSNGDRLRTCALRPQGIFGPGDTLLLPMLVGKAVAGRLRIVGAGDNKIDMTYVDNAVQAHPLAAEALATDEMPCGGRAYFIANDEPVNVWTFFNGILEELGVPKVQRRVPTGVAKVASAVVEGTWRTLGIKSEPPVTRAMVSVIANNHYFDLSAAKRDLGYQPEVRLADGVQRTIPWLKQELERRA